MNLFFILNFSISLIIANSILHFVNSEWSHFDYVVNGTVIILIGAYAWWRGRFALQISQGKLRVNNYPFSHSFLVQDVQTVSCENKKVIVLKNDGTETTLTFLFGISNAIQGKAKYLCNWK